MKSMTATTSTGTPSKIKEKQKMINYQRTLLVLFFSLLSSFFLYHHSTSPSAKDKMQTAEPIKTGEHKDISYNIASVVNDVSDSDVENEENKNSKSMNAESPAVCGNDDDTSGDVFAYGRVVSLADIHGDADAMIEILENAKVIKVTNEGEIKWIGGNTVLVQLGDVIDRGPKTKTAYDILFSLRKQAKEVGGCVVMLLGNHELMNLQGMFYYADEDETREFGDRKKAMSESGYYGKLLRSTTRLSVVVHQVQTGLSTLYAHAGMRLQTLKEYGGSITAMNQKVRKVIEKATLEGIRHATRYDRLFLDEGPLWTRYFAKPGNEQKICNELDEVLKLAKATRFVVGHTVQPTRNPGKRCGGKMVLSDCGLSAIYQVGGCIVID